MNLVVLSDLHVWGKEDPVYQSLLTILRERVSAGDTLVLAGDVFDLFIGNKKVFRERYAEFLSELVRAGERGVATHYIEGNHDFLMKRALGSIPGLHLHKHDFALELGGKRFFFAHGDTADRKDYSYRALRAFFRSPPMRAFVRLAPGSWIDGIGKLSSRHSRGAKPALASSLPTKNLEGLRKVYRNFAAERIAGGYDFVVMGHCHDLDEMAFVVGGHSGQYINVGFPRTHGSYLSWTPGDEKISRERLR
jgi:UDP-2,3-diacylglucosamine hydrolase